MVPGCDPWLNLIAVIASIISFFLGMGLTLLLVWLNAKNQEVPEEPKDKD